MSEEYAFLEHLEGILSTKHAYAHRVVICIKEEIERRKKDLSPKDTCAICEYQDLCSVRIAVKRDIQNHCGLFKAKSTVIDVVQKSEYLLAGMCDQFRPAPKRKTDADLLREMGPQHEHDAAAVIYFDFEHVSSSVFLFQYLGQEADDRWTIFYGFTVTILYDKNTGRAVSCYGSIKVNLPLGLTEYESGWNEDVEMPLDQYERCLKDARSFAEKLRENIGLMVFVGDDGEFYVAKGETNE